MTRPEAGDQEDDPGTTNAKRSRALLAGCIGNLVEWYDFALYGAFAAVIATTFFPASSSLEGLVGAFSVFGIAFVARPFGAIAFGHYGDRLGRRRALALSIIAMAIATAGIGLLPGHSRIGWLAAVLLIVLRTIQGVAIGGEFGGSAALVVEFAPDGARGRYGGWQWATVGFGLALGLGTSAALAGLLSAEAVAAWGWRLPFVAALPLGLVGFYVRARLDETPSFRATRQAGVTASAPVVELVRGFRRQVAVGFGIVAAISVTFNIFYVFLPGYLVAQHEVSLDTALGAAFTGLLLGSAVAPAFGRLSDQVGRRPVLLGGMTALMVLVVPAFRLVAEGSMAAMLVGYVLVGLPLGSLAITAVLAEMFPTAVRYSGLSLTYGLATAVFGGTAPAVAAAMVQRTGSLRLPLSFVGVMVSTGFVCSVFTRETANRPLDEAATADTRRAEVDATLRAAP